MGRDNTSSPEKSLQLVATFFESVWALVAMHHLLTTTHHLHMNGRAERFHSTLVIRSQYYVSEHQTDWAEYVQPLSYAYNKQVHRSHGTPPFDLELTRHPQVMKLAERSTAPRQSAHHEPIVVLGTFELGRTARKFEYFVRYIRDGR